MTYFVIVNKHGDSLENLRMGGYKDVHRAFEQFRRYATSEVKVFTGEGLKTVAFRVKGKEFML
jgi:hypothetical protein